jgi:hypothetical protein
MAKTETLKDAAAPAEVSEFPVTLTEFCSRLSATDKRVELIAAFHHDEEAAGRLSDLEGAYRTRLAAFAARPV